MHQTILALAVALFATSPTVATPQTEVMATVHQFVVAFNKGDTKAIAATCADQAIIIDEFSPYEWHGAGSCSKWVDDYTADATKNKITDGRVSLGNPRHVDVVADHAYVVVPANYAYKQNGKPVRENGSTLTIALQRTGSAWRITGWAWTKR